jgi:hypothetical protein
MKTRLILFLILFVLSAAVRADYNILRLQSEEPPPPPPFEISSVEADGESLRLLLSTDNIGAVQTLLETGQLIAQLSHHQGDDAESWPVALSLGKAVVCTEGANRLLLALADPLPEGCAAPFSINYYFETNATLGPGRDVAIGYDPHHLWLVEENQ